MTDVKEATQTELSYHIIISGINEATFSQSVNEFAYSFNLTNQIAEQILKTLPIILLSNLPRNEMKAIKMKLLELSKSGIEFTVSPTLSPDIPGVIWPLPSYYKEVSGGKAVQYIDSKSDHNAFVCPNCKESFIFQRISNPFGVSSQAQEQLLGVTSSPQKTESKTVSSVSPVTEENIMELTPVELKDGEQLEPSPILEEEEIIAEPLEEIEEEILESPETLEEPVLEETDCTLLLQGINSKDKRESAAEIIAGIMNIPFEDVFNLVKRPAPVIKDLTESEAMECLERLKEIGISGKITKRKA